MSSTYLEILDIKLREEFEQTYNENDLFIRYCEEYGIPLTPESIAYIDEEHFKEFKEIMFEEYKNLRDY